MVGTLDQHLHAVERDDAHAQQADGAQLQRGGERVTLGSPCTAAPSTEKGKTPSGTRGRSRRDRGAGTDEREQ